MKRVVLSFSSGMLGLIALVYVYLMFRSGTLEVGSKWSPERRDSGFAFLLLIVGLGLV